MISIAGIALPYCVPTIVGDHREFVAGYALREFLARRPRVFLTWQDHDGPSICDCVELINLPYALGFRASLSEKVWSRIGAELLQGCNRASVEFAPGFSHVEDYYRGKSINRIDRATIQHITLCRHAAYPQTAVWPEGDFKLDNHTAVARDRFYASEACLAS